MLVFDACLCIRRLFSFLFVCARCLLAVVARLVFTVFRRDKDGKSTVCTTGVFPCVANYIDGSHVLYLGREFRESQVGVVVLLCVVVGWGTFAVCGAERSYLNAAAEVCRWVTSVGWRIVFP